MEINVDVNGDIGTLTLNGDLVAGTSEALKEEVEKLIEKKYLKIVIIMEKVLFMDSSGLGTCMAVYKAVKTGNGVLVFAGVTKLVEDVLRVTKADKKFLIAPDKLKALKIIDEM